MIIARLFLHTQLPGPRISPGPGFSMQVFLVERIDADSFASQEKMRHMNAVCFLRRAEKDPRNSQRFVTPKLSDFFSCVEASLLSSFFHIARVFFIHNDDHSVI